MKKRLINYTFIVLSIVLYACVNPSKTKKKTDKHDTELVLNDGQLWSANTATTVGVRKMVEIMKSFDVKDDVAAYKVLTESLKTEFTSIFQNCTMKGEAHTQLHNFLIPINDLFGNLESDDLTKCQESFEGLKKQLVLYDAYFK